MKRHLFFLSLVLPLTLWADLKLKDAYTQEINNINRGFAFIKHEGSRYSFSYDKIIVNRKKKGYAAINYFQQLELNDNKTLVIHKVDKKNRSTKTPLSFFTGTLDIKAKVVNDHFILLSARTPQGHLKLALLDKMKLRFSQTLNHLSIQKVYNTFSHLDGSFSLAVKVANQKNRLSYFQRGTGKTNIAILKFSPLLHLEATHFIGTSQSYHTVNVLKDVQESYYIINQETDKHISIYKHDFSTSRNEKKELFLKEKAHIHIASTQDFETFYFGASNSMWFKANIQTSHIQSYELAKLKSATVTSISVLPNSTLLVSGEYNAPTGAKNFFIHNYSPYQSYLWGNRFQGTFNNKLLAHYYEANRIYISALISDKVDHKHLALFQLNLTGKALKQK